jgi:hypothetical protein
VDIDHVENGAPTFPQHGCRRLGQEQWRFQVGPHQVPPVGFLDGAEGRGIKGRGVVDQDIQATKLSDRDLHQLDPGRGIQ